MSWRSRWSGVLGCVLDLALNLWMDVCKAAISGYESETQFGVDGSQACSERGVWGRFSGPGIEFGS